MGCILLFNIHDSEKKTAIRLTATRFRVPCVEVSPDQQEQTLDALLTGNEAEVPACRVPFTDEMMVMHALSSEAFHTLLDTLRKEGISIRLKAIVTEHNRNWTALRLYREISAEAAAMEKRKRK